MSYPTTTSKCTPGVFCGWAGMPSISEMFGRSGTRARGRENGITRMVLTQLITEWIALDDFPFSLVETDGFRRVFQYVMLWYTDPARITLSKSMLPLLYRAIQEHPKAHFSLPCGRTVHFTSHIWTSTHLADHILVATIQHCG